MNIIPLLYILGDMTVEQVGEPTRIEERARRLEDFIDLGFSPKTAGELSRHLKRATLENKITGFQEAGFPNPVRLIEKHPQVAGYNINRVRRRIKLIEQLNRQFSLEYEPISLIETFPVYLSYSKSRLFFFLRIGAFYNLEEALYRRLITINPFLLFSEILERRPQDEEGLRIALREVSKLSRSKKSEIIAKTREGLPELQKKIETQPTSEQRSFLAKLAINLQKQKSRG